MTSHILGLILITTALETAGMSSAATLQENQSYVGQIAAFAQGSPMLTVTKGPFLMGTARMSEGSFSLETQYDDTEQPQRRVWLDPFEIDRDEVSLGEYLSWLLQHQRAIPDEVWISWSLDDDDARSSTRSGLCVMSANPRCFGAMNP